MKKRQLRRMSLERLNENRLRREKLEERFGPRSEWTCSVIGRPHHSEMGECFGPINGHELRKRSQGGSITDMNNVILLCNYHNGWVEDHPLAARRLGLTLNSWELPKEQA